MALQLGLDPVTHGTALGARNPDAYTIGNEAMRQRWADPDGLVILGEKTIADWIIKIYDTIWNDKILHVMAEGYDRAIRFEGPAGQICYGQARTGDIFSSIMASIPNGHFEPHHVIVRQQPEKAIRVALRWSYCGTHGGHGRYGPPTGYPLALLGISHFELRDGRIVNEWLVVDETAIYAQVGAYEIA
jgi:predicted ester cyclase